MNTQSNALRLADALDDEFVQARISNYTGRKAAAELRRLHEANQELLGALQNLYDEQNDAPLERHRVWWKAAMEKARAAIEKHGENK